MRLWDWFWRQLGYKKIWLFDFDGDITIVWGTPVNLNGVKAYRAHRFPFLYSPILCFPDGSVAGEKYVKSWQEEV